MLLWHSSKPSAALSRSLTNPQPVPLAVPDGAGARRWCPALSPARLMPLARKRPWGAGLCGAAAADWPARRARGSRGPRRGANRCGAGPGQRQRSGWIWQWRRWGARARRRSTSRSAMKWPRSARSCSWTS